MGIRTSRRTEHYPVCLLVVAWGLLRHSRGQLPNTIPIDTGPPTQPASVSDRGYSFLFSQGPFTWAQAEADCVTKGGHLASIESSEEELRVRTLCTAPSGCWVGLHEQTADGVYLWTDGSATTYSKLSSAVAAAPSADGSDATVEQPCILLLNDKQGWQNMPCSAEHAYVCKVATQESQSTVTPPSGDSPGSATAATGPVGTLNITLGVSNSSTNSTAVLPSTTSPAAGVTEVAVDSNNVAVGKASMASVSSVPTPATVSDSASLSRTQASSEAAGHENPSSAKLSPQATVVTQQITASTASLGEAALGVSPAAGQSPDASKSSSSADEGMEPWKLILSIVVPVVTGIAAIITGSYRGWKWWQRRRGLLAQRKFHASLLPSSGSLASQSSGRLIRAYY